MFSAPTDTSLNFCEYYHKIVMTMLFFIASAFYSYNSFERISSAVFFLIHTVPSPISITLSPSHPSPYFAGSTVTLTCEAMASSLIDTSINVVFSWTRNGEVISDDNRVTITQASSTATTHQSILTINQLNHELDNGLYQCLAFFEPVSSSQYLSPSGAESTSSLNLSIQGILVTMQIFCSEFLSALSYVFS